MSPDSVISNDVIEHVMRIATDEIALAAFTAVNDRRLAVGQLLSHAGHDRLDAGTPLQAWLINTEPDPEWRARVPARPGSVWLHYLALVELVGPVNPLDSLTVSFWKLYELAEQRLGTAA